MITSLRKMLVLGLFCSLSVAAENLPTFPIENGQLVIKETLFSYAAENGTAPLITVLGTIKNDSPNPVSTIAIEIKFFNADNAFVDVITQDLYNVSVPASSEVAFRMRDSAAKPKEAYVSSVVRIISATPDIPRAPKESPSRWRGLLSLLSAWGPMILFLVVFVYFLRKQAGKSSPVVQSVDLIAAQNALLAEHQKQNQESFRQQLAVLERLATAVEKTAGITRE